MKSKEWKQARDFWRNEGPIRKSSKQDILICIALFLLLLFELSNILFNIFFVVSYPTMDARYMYGDNQIGKSYAVDGWQTSKGYVGGHIFADLLSLLWISFILFRYIKHKSLPFYWMVSLLINTLYIGSALPGYKENYDLMNDNKAEFADNWNIDSSQVTIILNSGAFLYYYQFYFELAFTITPAVIAIIMFISLHVQSSGRIIYKN